MSVFVCMGTLGFSLPALTARYDASAGGESAADQPAHRSCRAESAAGAGEGEQADESPAGGWCSFCKKAWVER